MVTNIKYQPASHVYLANKGGTVLPTVHMCEESFSPGEVEREVKNVAIEFSDCGPPIEEVMALNITFDFVRLHLDRTST